MAFQIRRAHRFFSPPQDQIALRTSDHASRGKSPGTFPAFRVYLRVGFAVTGIFVGIVRTTAIPPSPVPGDCVLSVSPGSSFSLSGLRASDGTLIANSPVEVLIDPFNDIHVLNAIDIDPGDRRAIAERETFFQGF